MPGAADFAAAAMVDPESRIEELIAGLRSAEARAANAEARLQDAERIINDRGAELRAAEARAANAEARLQDAQRLIDDRSAELLAAEARAANAEARLQDAERWAADRQRDLLILKNLRTTDPLAELTVEVVNQPDTALESLLREYGFLELSALIKSRRCVEEVGDHRRPAARSGEGDAPAADRPSISSETRSA